MQLEELSRTSVGLRRIGERPLQAGHRRLPLVAAAGRRPPARGRPGSRNGSSAAACQRSSQAAARSGSPLASQRRPSDSKVAGRRLQLRHPLVGPDGPVPLAQRLDQQAGDPVPHPAGRRAVAPLLDPGGLIGQQVDQLVVAVARLQQPGQRLDGGPVPGLLLQVGPQHLQAAAALLEGGGDLVQLEAQRQPALDLEGAAQLLLPERQQLGQAALLLVEGPQAADRLGILDVVVGHLAQHLDRLAAVAQLVQGQPRHPPAQAADRGPGQGQAGGVEQQLDRPGPGAAIGAAQLDAGQLLGRPGRRLGRAQRARGRLIGPQQPGGLIEQAAQDGARQRLGAQRSQGQGGRLLQRIQIAGGQIGERQQGVAQGAAGLAPLGRRQPAQDGQLRGGQPLASGTPLPGFAHAPGVEGRPGQGGLGPLRPTLAAGGLALAGDPGLEIAGQGRVGAALRVVQHGGRRLGQLSVAPAFGGQRLQQRQHRPLERLAGHLGRQRRLGRHLPVARAGGRPHQRLAQLRPGAVAHEGRPVGLLGRGRFPARLEELALLEAQAARPHRILGDLRRRRAGPRRPPSIRGSRPPAAPSPSRSTRLRARAAAPAPAATGRRRDPPPFAPARWPPRRGGARGRRHRPRPAAAPRTGPPGPASRPRPGRRGPAPRRPPPGCSRARAGRGPR